MSAQELLQAGKIQEAIQLLSNELRDRPGDNQRRTFLFELLCFAGDFGRAEKHLNLLSDANADAAVGGLMYRSALSAERKRQAFFEAKQYENAPPPSKFRPGTINGEKFNSIEDIDPRIGPRLEVFIAGEYVWLPFRTSVRSPRNLRGICAIFYGRRLPSRPVRRWKARSSARC